MANRRYGPWTTSLDASYGTALGRLWQRRVLRLAHVAGQGRRLRASGRAAVVLAALAALGLPELQGTRAPAAAPNSLAKSAAVPEKGPAASRAPGAPVRVEIPGGALAEVVAVGMHPSQGQPWWAPDGKPAVAPYDVFKSRVNPGDGYFVREIAVRWLKHPPELELMSGVVGGGSAAAGKPADAHGATIAEINTTAQAFPAGTKTATLRFTVGLGAWETVGRTDGEHDFAMGTEKYSVAFTRTSQRSEGLTLSAAHNITRQDVRLVAVNREGRIVTAPYVARGAGGAFVKRRALSRACIQRISRSFASRRDPIGSWKCETSRSIRVPRRLPRW